MSLRILFLLGAGLLVFGCGSSDSSTPESASSTAPEGATARIPYQLEVPAAWTARTPSNTMRLAEYETPGVDGEAGAEVIIYYFGPGQGGSAEDNIARWSSQFTSPEGDPVTPAVTHFESAAFPITLAEFRGTYARNTGMGMGGQEPRENQALLAAVVETPQGNLFVQLFGPIATATAQRDAYLDFVRSIRP